MVASMAGFGGALVEKIYQMSVLGHSFPCYRIDFGFLHIIRTVVRSKRPNQAQANTSKNVAAE